MHLAVHDTINSR